MILEHSVPSDDGMLGMWTGCLPHGLHSISISFDDGYIFDDSVKDI